MKAIMYIIKIILGISSKFKLITIEINIVQCKKESFLVESVLNLRQLLDKSDPILTKAKRLGFNKMIKVANGK